MAVEETKTTALEGVLIVCEDGQPVAMVRKNGHNEFYRIEPMGFEEIGELLGAGKVQGPNQQNG
jgi:hypothetical protein